MEPPVFSDQSKPKGRKRTKKDQYESHWDETWVSDWDWYSWKSWDDWEAPAKKRKQNPKQRMAGYVESGTSESTKPEPTTKKGPDSTSKPASEKVEKTKGANKRKGKGKAGSEENPGDEERRLFDPVKFAFDDEKSKDELLAKGYQKPPAWVEPGNVYSNQYRRSKAIQEIPNLEQVREAAKAATKVFREHGLCHPELMDSFASEKRAKKEKHGKE